MGEYPRKIPGTALSIIIKNSESIQALSLRQKIGGMFRSIFSRTLPEDREKLIRMAIEGHIRMYMNHGKIPNLILGDRLYMFFREGVSFVAVCIKSKAGDERVARVGNIEELAGMSQGIEFKSTPEMEAFAKYKHNLSILDIPADILDGMSLSEKEDFIARIYRDQAKDSHPDTHPDDTTAKQRFQRFAVAFDEAIKFLKGNEDTSKSSIPGMLGTKSADESHNRPTLPSS